VRNSVCHNATVIANGLMHCGTTSDQFLRYVHTVSLFSCYWNSFDFLFIHLLIAGF